MKEEATFRAEFKREAISNGRVVFALLVYIAVERGLLSDEASLYAEFLLVLGIFILSAAIGALIHLRPLFVIRWKYPGDNNHYVDGPRALFELRDDQEDVTVELTLAYREEGPIARKLGARMRAAACPAVVMQFQPVKGIQFIEEANGTLPADVESNRVIVRPEALGANHGFVGFIAVGLKPDPRDDRQLWRAKPVVQCAGASWRSRSIARLVQLQTNVDEVLFARVPTRTSARSPRAEVAALTDG